MTNLDLITPSWPVPDNVHALITTRSSGFSQAPYAGNNLGLHVGDDPTQVNKNRARLCEHAGLSKAPQWLEQVHGIEVIHAKADGIIRTADGSYTHERGQACLVMTADCLPLLLCDKQGTQVAALHCGWRSLAKGICARGVGKFNHAPNDLIAYLGPAISQAHFEVGADVLEAFLKSARNPNHHKQIADAFIPAQRPLHFFADIYALARAELVALGITAIYGGDYCTYSESDRFYSYRRDRVTGRMASLIWLDV